MLLTQSRMKKILWIGRSAKYTIILLWIIHLTPSPMEHIPTQIYGSPVQSTYKYNSKTNSKNPESG